MHRFRFPEPVDLAPFRQPDSADLKALYGLPREVAFCRRCVISNQRPNTVVEFQHTVESTKRTINFDAEGICDACRMAEKKSRGIDWAERERELRDLCDRFRSKDGSYDCLVPGSGGKDSFYAAHMLKYKYNMHPLTCTWAPHIYTDWGFKNFQAWIHAGFDNYLFTPNGRVHRLLTRLAVERLFHPFQPFIIGQKAFPPKMAVQHKIPLVIYGEQEVEYGTPLAEATKNTRDGSFFTTGKKSDTFFGGVSVADLEENFGIGSHELLPYVPLDPRQIRDLGVEVHYLGYYLKWHPQSCYYYSVEHGGFQASPERTPGTYSKYNSIDDRIDDFHYYTMHIKFGIGRAMSDAAQEIRSGDITRDEGVALIKRFDGEFPERFAEEILRYLSLPPKEFPEAVHMFEQPIMSREYFGRLTDHFRSPHLWRREGDGWCLRRPIWEAAPR